MKYSNLHLHERWGWGPKWDQAHIYRMLTELNVGWAPTHLVTKYGGVLVFAAGDHVEYDIRSEIEKMPWCVLIATSDEHSRYDWSKWELPPNLKLWVQLPRVTNPYPEGTRFFGEMAPTPGITPLLPASRRLHTVTFRGQVQNGRRRQCWRAMTHLALDGVTVNIARTEGFAQGLPRQEYLAELGEAMFVACPSGTATQSSFRVFESLEAGAIPIVDAVNPVDGEVGYWEAIGLGWLPQVHYWETDLRSVVAKELVNRNIDVSQQITMRRWEAHKAMMLNDLRNDILSAQQGAHTR